MVESSIAGISRHMRAWEALQACAVEDNVYCTPGFLIPALLHYGKRSPACVVFVYRNTHESSELIACAAFSNMPSGPRAPLSVMSTFVSPHSYLSHPLIHAEHVEPAIAALWDWLEARQRTHALLRLDRMQQGSPVWRAIRAELRRRGRPYWVRSRCARAALRRHGCFEDYLKTLSPGRRKDFRRKWRMLERAGRAEVVLHRAAEDAPELAWRFMALEHKSWKGASGTALASSPDDAAFFTDVTARFGARNQLFYVELRLDGRPIAMTANFACGRTLFAFKVGYDPAFARYSPGVLVELAGIRLLHEISELERGDSGAAEGSYVSSYWSDQVELQTVYVPAPRLPAWAMVHLMPHAQQAKRALTTHAREVRDRLQGEPRRPGS